LPIVAAPFSSPLSKWTACGLIAIAIASGVSFPAARAAALTTGSQGACPTSEICLGNWRVALDNSGISGLLVVTGGGNVLSGGDTVRFHHPLQGLPGFPQLGALHSTGSFRLARAAFSHNIYSVGFGGTQIAAIAVELSGSDLVLKTDRAAAYTVPPVLGGPVVVTGATICLLTSGTVDLASKASLDGLPRSIPCSSEFQPLGSASESFGIRGHHGVDSLGLDARRG